MPDVPEDLLREAWAALGELPSLFQSVGSVAQQARRCKPDSKRSKELWAKYDDFSNRASNESSKIRMALMFAGMENLLIGDRRAVEGNMNANTNPTPAPLAAGTRVLITKGCNSLGITKGTTATVVEATPLGAEYAHSVKVVLRFVNGAKAGKTFALFARHPNRLADVIVRFNNGNPLKTVEVRRS